ncbi:MAG: alpha/beta fold hydrolase, partial [Chromatocurvus sp.]
MRQLIVLVVGLALVATSLWQLEQSRSGVSTRSMTIGETPATLYWDATAAPSPVVVVSHGFAGSRQLMQAFSFHLARAGYRVVAFDALGHGRNPVPMSGDVTVVEGTTALLVAETRRVVHAARQVEGASGKVAVLGHSMASDIVIRAALAEPGVDNVIAISMFSEAVTAKAPERLLVISGEWEGRLREVALKAVRPVDPEAGEGETVSAGDVQRRAAVSPN